MPNRILRSPNDLNADEIRALYMGFNSPITVQDCGEKCALHNPSGKPFCCDICEALPAAYKSEWDTLRETTKLWHLYQGDECDSQPHSQDSLSNDDLPSSMIPLACLGPEACERENRLLSCRQFPFFPYVTSNYEFLGLAYDWAFEEKCWVISNLGQVTEQYKEEFIRAYDKLFALFQDEFDSYAIKSEEIREAFIEKKREIPLLYRDGGYSLINPENEHIYSADENQLPRFGVYR
ncbi:MAG: hypothetical protein HN390_02460 [Anaerolineae bacterium]|jgi:hypothetical protein|nr:hypothetical protein [Anaerolineae bacterium]MBT7191920.1 hypothetical protein [Anaerolineae bacterium]MBT7989358.1 hypothetical protein [Anaerolineae bacterium]